MTQQVTEPQARRARGGASRLGLVLLLVLGTLAAACGARLTDEERTQAIADLRGGGGGGSGGTGSEVAADGGIATDVDGGTGGTTGGTGGTGGTTGGTGGTGGSGGTGGGDTCTPGQATGPGVTPTEIRIGNVSQITGLVPNFARTSVNGVKAYFNYINNSGGVCGRRLRLIEADDRFQSATNRAETEKLTSQVLAFAGSLSVVDDGGAPIIDQAGVADVSLATTNPRAAAKNNFSPNPFDPAPNSGAGFTPALRYFKETFGLSKAAIFYQDVATGVNQSNNYKINFQEAGIPVVATYPVAPTATNFQSQATDMQQKGIDIVITVAEVNAMANLARAFGDVGYFPKVPFYGAQSYGQKFLQLAGASAEGTMAALIFNIPEEGTAEVNLMKQWYERTAPGADLDFFSLLSWVAGEMLVQALRAAGPDPTQEKIVAELSKLTEFKSTIAAPINPAGKKPSPCFHVVEVKGGKWQKQHPASGFDCG